MLAVVASIATLLLGAPPPAPARDAGLPVG